MKPIVFETLVEKNMKSKIIGISGNMGAGKTTLAEALALGLQATMIGWDEFDDISSGPDDLVDWYKRGQNHNEWNYQALADVLESLKSDQSILHPTRKCVLHPKKYIVFDAPLGRLHPQTGQYIDVCIHIEVPLDVSLSRHLIRDFKANDKTKDELLDELEYYLSHSRPLFFDYALKASADFIIDGMMATDNQVEVIKKYLTDVEVS